jgi:hypothetical protein
LSDEEVRRVVDHFFGQEIEYHSLPEEDSPGFLAELQRRAASPAPALSPQTVAAFLRAREGERE